MVPPTATRQPNAVRIVAVYEPESRAILLPIAARPDAAIEIEQLSAQQLQEWVTAARVYRVQLMESMEERRN